MICLLLIAVFIGLSFGQGDICDGIKGLNTTRIRQRVNESNGAIIAYSEISLFLQNGSLYEINLQNQDETRIGVYRIREESKNDDTVCILEREIEGTTSNRTDCETLTVLAKSNSAEGLEGCTVGNITNSNQCLESCRGQDGGLVTDDLVAYIITGKLDEDKIPKNIEQPPYKF